MKKIKITTVLMAAILVLANGSAASAFDSDPVDPAARQFVWSQPNDVQLGPQQGKSLYAYSFIGGQDNLFTSSVVSSGTTGKVCDFTANCLGTSYNANGNFPMCSATVGAPCIEGLAFKNGDGAYVDAKLLGFADPSPTKEDIDTVKKWPNVTSVPDQTLGGWAQNAIPGIPASSSGPAIFEVPGFTNSAGTQTYVLQAKYMFEGYLGVYNGGTVRDFSVNLIPTLIDNTKYNRQVFFNTQNGWGGSGFGPGAGPYMTSYVSKDSIGYGAQFPPKTTVQLKLKLNSSLGGWFQGRGGSPVMTVNPTSGDANDVTIESEPTKVPIAQSIVDVLDPANSGYYTAMGLGESYVSQERTRVSGGQAGLAGSYWDPARGIDVFEKLSPTLGPKAWGFINLWYFKHFESKNKCMDSNSQLNGILTTNAMVYQPDLPSYSDGFLNYSVAGLHLDADGKPFEGTYSFTMRDSIAKCLYGFNGNAPISGTVSVTSSEGDEHVAATSVTDKNGWLNLSAEGFTFSSPTISAKLSQADSKPAVTSTATQSSSPQPLKTIRCKKGKLVKVFSGQTAKCPKGYNQAP